MGKQTVTEKTSALGQRLTIYEWPSHDRFTSTQRTNVEARINVCIGPEADNSSQPLERERMTVGDE
jgi:hypothetical protein